MKNYKVEKRPTPILDECYCDKCKKPFNEDELIEIECYVDLVNLAHGEFCNKCLYSLIKDHCRYNYDTGWDQKSLDEYNNRMENYPDNETQECFGLLYTPISEADCAECSIKTGCELKYRQNIKENKNAD